MLSSRTKRLIIESIAEDVGTGDITSIACIPENTTGRAIMLARQPLTVCGHEAAAEAYSCCDSRVRYQSAAPDGSAVEAGAVIAEITGPLRGILSGERTAVNFLQRLSGIATMTAQLAAKIAGTGVKILDTRKTTPGWRELEKYAVRMGGGTNHRFGLYDAVLIKNNHIDALAGDISSAVQRCRAYAARGMKVEVEVRDKHELMQALQAAPDAILLDNLQPEEVAELVKIARAAPGGSQIELEASGGINGDNILRYAETGIDSLSLGMLTHSVCAVDISLRFSSASPGGDR